MIFISHRGNIDGKNPDKENRMDYIFDALNRKFDVEIDAWYENKQWWLGHDEPKYKTGTSIFNNEKVWVHAKNPEALRNLKEMPHCHYFWHEDDDYTITSKGFVWCHKDAIVLPNTIAVLPESDDPFWKEPLWNCRGVCSDEIGDFKGLHG